MKTVYIDLKDYYLDGDLDCGAFHYIHNIKRIIIENVKQVVLEDYGLIRIDYKFHSRSKNLNNRFFKVNEIEKLVIN